MKSLQERIYVHIYTVNMTNFSFFQNARCRRMRLVHGRLAELFTFAQVLECNVLYCDETHEKLTYTQSRQFVNDWIAIATVCGSLSLLIYLRIDLSRFSRDTPGDWGYHALPTFHSALFIDIFVFFLLIIYILVQYFIQLLFNIKIFNIK